MQKLSATRWAKELTNKMYAGDFEGAEAMGKRMAHAGLKPRRVGTSIGSGADAVVDTLAGKIPGKQQPGLVAAKFISQERVGMSLGDHLKERAIVADLLGDLGAKNYGIYRKGQGAVELQEYLPGVITDKSQAKVIEAKARRGFKARIRPGKKLYDISDHLGNVRLTSKGVPKIVDAAVDRPWARVGSLRSWQDQLDTAHSVGARALRGAQKGTSFKMKTPSVYKALAKHLVRHPAAKGIGATGLVVALAALTNKRK